MRSSILFAMVPDDRIASELAARFLRSHLRHSKEIIRKIISLFVFGKTFCIFVGVGGSHLSSFLSWTGLSIEIVWQCEYLYRCLEGLLVGVLLGCGLALCGRMAISIAGFEGGDSC